MDSNDDKKKKDYYKKRFEDELHQLNTSLNNIRQLTWESFVDFVRQIAEKIGVDFNDFLDSLGPLFNDPNFDD